MRLLTKGGELQSVLTLLRWMDRFAVELVKMKDESANGDRQMRLALCVAAMALEDLDTSLPELAGETQQVRELIEKNPAWGGWPQDHELSMYLVKGKPSERLRRRT